MLAPNVVAAHGDERDDVLYYLCLRGCWFDWTPCQSDCRCGFLLAIAILTQQRALNPTIATVGPIRFERRSDG